MIARRAVFALAVAAVALLFAIAGRVERVIGGAPTVRYQVTLSADALAVPSDRVIATWRTRLRDHDVTIGAPTHGPDGMTIAVEVSGPTAAQADAIGGALEARGALSFHRVVDDTPTARGWFRALNVDDDHPLRPDKVRAWPDSWYVERTSEARQDYFVAGPSRAAIATALAALGPDAAVPDDLALRYEDFIPTHDDGTLGEPLVRTYLVDPAPFLTQADVASAHVTYDPNTLRPEVALEFSPDGGARFGDATARWTGSKIAMVVDGRVVSAPIVQGAIRGGRSSITMGGNDPAAQEAEAEALVAALRTGHLQPLPAGIHARLVGVDGGVGPRWLARLAALAIAGVLAWFSAAFVARRRGPALDASIELPRWGRLAVAVAVTLGLPALLIVVARNVELPGLTAEIFDILERGSGAGSSDLSQVGIFALGIMPLVSAFWVTELLALVVPSWHRARLGTAADRRTIDRVALAVTLGLAGLQAYFILQYFESINARGLLVIADGALPRVALIATLIGGVMVHVVAAELITRHGLANGVVVLLAAGAAMTLWQLRPHGATDPRWMVVAVIVAIAVLAAVASRQRIGASRMPWTGVTPVLVVGVAVALMAPSVVVWALAGEWLAALARRPWWFDLAVATAVVAVVIWHRRAEAAPLPIAISLGFVLALVAAPFLIDAAWRPAVDVLAAATLGVAVVELVVGAWARLRLDAPIAIAMLHDVDRADRLATTLASAGIDHAVLGVHARAILRMFGAYCPIVVQVSALDADRARELVASTER